MSTIWVNKTYITQILKAQASFHIIFTSIVFLYCLTGNNFSCSYFKFANEKENINCITEYLIKCLWVIFLKVRFFSIKIRISTKKILKDFLWYIEMIVLTKALVINYVWDVVQPSAVWLHLSREVESLSECTWISPLKF